MKLAPDDRLAWNVYVDAVNMSPFGERGLPTITFLPDVLRWLHLNLDPASEYALLERIKLIHFRVMQIRISKLPTIPAP